jgi:hypothetical protein
MSILAEFRALIETAIPRIIALLSHSAFDVPQAGVDALSKLSENCKII